MVANATIRAILARSLDLLFVDSLRSIVCGRRNVVAEHAVHVAAAGRRGGLAAGCPRAAVAAAEAGRSGRQSHCDRPRSRVAFVRKKKPLRTAGNRNQQHAHAADQGAGGTAADGWHASSRRRLHSWTRRQSADRARGQLAVPRLCGGAGRTRLRHDRGGRGAAHGVRGGPDADGRTAVGPDALCGLPGIPAGGRPNADRLRWFVLGRRNGHVAGRDGHADCGHGELRVSDQDGPDGAQSLPMLEIRRFARTGRFRRHLFADRPASAAVSEWPARAAVAIPGFAGCRGPGEIGLVYADYGQPQNAALLAHLEGHIINVPGLLAFFDECFQPSR